MHEIDPITLYLVQIMQDIAYFFHRSHCFAWSTQYLNFLKSSLEHKQIGISAVNCNIHPAK